MVGVMPFATAMPLWLFLMMAVSVLLVFWERLAGKMARVPCVLEILGCVAEVVAPGNVAFGPGKPKA